MLGLNRDLHLQGSVGPFIWTCGDPTAPFPFFLLFPYAASFYAKALAHSPHESPKAVDKGWRERIPVLCIVF